MRYTLFEPLFEDPADADRIAAIARAFGPHGMYSEEGENAGIGDGLPQRYDAFLNYVTSHARVPKGRLDPARVAARTNYFRETWAYGTTVRAPGIEIFRDNPRLVEAARGVFGRPVIEPAIVFANLYVPGQELSVHTDVPEFRGANRKVLPQWLLVAMHHSGLFADWHMPIATCVSWYSDNVGGAFVFYPDGVDAPPRIHEIAANTGILLDTDSVFHGVGRVSDAGHAIPALKSGMVLAPAEGEGWVVRSGDQVIDRYRWSELRLSVSWKAYCFRDETERRLWREKADDLSLDFIMVRLTGDLRRRGVLGATEQPERRRLAELIIATYIRFPPPHPALVPDAFAA